MVDAILEPQYSVGIDWGASPDMSAFCIAKRRDDGTIELMSVGKSHSYEKLATMMRIGWMKAQLPPAKNRSNRLIKKLYNRSLQGLFYGFDPTT